MQTWKILGLASAVLVVWGGVMLAGGYRPSPVTVGVATAFVVVSLYVGDLIGRRLVEE